MPEEDAAGPSTSGSSMAGPSGDKKRGKITGCFVKVSKEEYLKAEENRAENKVKVNGVHDDKKGKVQNSDVTLEVNGDAKEEAGPSTSSTNGVSSGSSSRPRPDYKSMDVQAEVDDREEDPDFDKDSSMAEVGSSSSGRKRRSCVGASGANRPKRQRKGAGGERKVVPKCAHCRQPIEDPDKLTFYEGHPNEAKMEVEALFDPALQVDFIEGSQLDDRPEYRLTQFTFYDREGHVVPFGSGLVERNVELLFSGYIKPVYDDNPNAEGGVAMCDGGPLAEWWAAGFDGGERHLVGVSTEYAHYYLTAPSPAYEPFMEDVDRKVFLTKLIVERLVEARATMENVEHEDLLHLLEGRAPPGYPDRKLSNDDLVKYADFIVSSVYSYEEAGDEDEETWMMDLPCIQEIINISGLKRNRVREKGSRVRIRVTGAESAAQKMRKAVFTKATTTPLIRLVFETFFKDQIAEDGKKSGGTRKRRCGKCDGCLVADCKKCSHCLDMKKYGGKGTGKQACIKRKCEAPIEALMDGDGEDEEEYIEVDDEDVKHKSILARKKEEEMGRAEKDEEEEDDKENNRTNVSAKKRKSDQKSAKDFFKPQRSSDATVGNKIQWMEKDTKQKIGNKTFFKSVTVKGETFQRGDFALVSYLSEDDGRKTYLRRVANLFEDDQGQKYAHVHWYDKGNETVLTDAAEDNEVFQVVYCDNALLSNFSGKAHAVYWPPLGRKEFVATGGTEEAALAAPPIPKEIKDQENVFYYKNRYDEECCRFEQALDVAKPESENADQLDFCAICDCDQMRWRKAGKVTRAAEPTGDQDEEGSTRGGALHLFRAARMMNETFRVNDAVFYNVAGFAAGSAKSSGGKSRQDDDLEKRKREVDEEKYPEFYRKTVRVKGSNETISKPFGIGIITQVVSQDSEGRRGVKLRVRKLYRPENTSLTPEEAFSKDLNFVYWSDDVITVDSSSVRGRCFVRNENHLEVPAPQWTREGQYRFYYNMAYSRHRREFEELPVEAERYGRQAKGGGKGKKSSKKPEDVSCADGKSASSEEKAPSDGAHPKISRPLRCLDVFAGCGGLSLGLHQSGVADSAWAIEVFEPAANAYKLNNPNCEVFTDDCNELLKLAIDGEGHNSKRQRLPEKGEVELLCGGPPCQGFSGMNRFNYREYSSFKNSLIASYLSYADYYRPNYFILENVRNFATFKKSAVLRLCIKGLLKMGYSVTFGILQAGHYGVSQTRRRAILLAAAPGESLPFFPEPQHVFVTTPLSAQVGEKICQSNIKWMDSAPYRTITVRDCMSDLPEVQRRQQVQGQARQVQHHGQEVTSYNCEPRTHFQKMMRRNVESNGLIDHITKVMSPLVEARMALIPTLPGSDWRDLPNTVVKLSDGTYTEKLVYNYADYLRGKSSTGALRGVCKCMSGKHRQCDPEDKQTNTIIPWCLPHTSGRHNQWAGLYGRLEYDGFFSTTVTNPEPMGKQGRVLHPEQDRLVSVRECARSQGFPDWYRFYGNVLDKHRQVGNAVAPPMGFFLGLEVRKAMAKAREAAPHLFKEEEEEVKAEVKEEQEEDDGMEEDEKKLLKELMEEEEDGGEKEEGEAGAGGSGSASNNKPADDDYDSD